MPKLSHVTLEDTDMADRIMTALANTATATASSSSRCRQLQRLDIIRCSTITDEVLTKTLSCCTSLKTLTLHNCETVITDVFLRSALTLPLSLERLSITDCFKGNPIFSSDSHGYGEELVIELLGTSGGELRSLNLSSTQKDAFAFTDRLLTCIGDYCHKLEHLDISGSIYYPLISQESIEALTSKCTQLKDIKLHKSRER
jgi:hypothetical protein